MLTIIERLAEEDHDELRSGCAITTDRTPGFFMLCYEVPHHPILQAVPFRHRSRQNQSNNGIGRDVRSTTEHLAFEMRFVFVSAMPLNNPRCFQIQVVNCSTWQIAKIFR